MKENVYVQSITVIWITTSCFNNKNQEYNILTFVILYERIISTLLVPGYLKPFTCEPALMHAQCCYYMCLYL